MPYNMDAAEARFIEEVFERHPDLLVTARRPARWRRDECICIAIIRPSNVRPEWQIVVDDIDLRDKARAKIHPLRVNDPATDAVLVLTPVQ